MSGHAPLPPTQLIPINTPLWFPSHSPSLPSLWQPISSVRQGLKHGKIWSTFLTALLIFQASVNPYDVPVQCKAVPSLAKVGRMVLLALWMRQALCRIASRPQFPCLQLRHFLHPLPAFLWHFAYFSHHVLNSLAVWQGGIWEKDRPPDSSGLGRLWGKKEPWSSSKIWY